MTEEPLSFFWSDLVFEKAAAVFAAHEAEIRGRLPDVEVTHHGSTSVPGLLTAGDVDVHVRVSGESFARTRDALSELYEPMFRDEWSSEVAYFFSRGSEPAVEVVLTLIGSLDDRHHRDVWIRLAEDGALIGRYSALKREHAGRSIDEYKAAKREFFREVVRSLDDTSE